MTHDAIVAYAVLGAAVKAAAKQVDADASGKTLAA